MLPTLPTHKPSLPLVPSCTIVCSTPHHRHWSCPVLVINTSPVHHREFFVTTSPVLQRAYFFTQFSSPARSTEARHSLVSPSTGYLKPLSFTLSHAALIRLGASGLQHCPDVGSPELRLVPRSPQFHLRPSTNQVLPGQSSLHHHHRLLNGLLRSIPPPLWPRRTQSRFHRGPHSHRCCFSRSVIGSISATHHRDSALVFHSLGIVWASPSPCITSVGLAQKTTLAPPSITAAVGRLHHGPRSGISSAVRSSLDPTTINSSMDPPISSSMAFSTVCSALVPAICHPMGFQQRTGPSVL